MAGDWSKVRIEDIAEKIAMGPFGSNIKVETFVDDGIPVISGAHLHGFRVEDGNFNFITEDHAERLKNSNVFRGDVIFTHAGNIGQVAYVPQDSQYERYVISQRQFYLRCKPDIADPAFITYFFHSAEGQHKLLANASQTGVPSIAQPSSYLKTIELLLPPLAEQRAIAHILGTLDDKIELNRKQNETLEAMARALFKAWFVDFEPVRAKMEGRWQRGLSLPGLPAHLYDLFPDRLVESELGEIPEGWEMRTVGDFADLQGGKQLEKDRIVPNGEIPVFGGAGVMGYTDTYNADGFVIAVGRVGAYCGQFFSHRGKAWINNNASLIRQKKEDFGEWLFLSLRHADIDVIKKGAAQPFVSNGDLSKLPLVWPGEKVVESFLQFTVPLLKGQEDANRESKFLALLRDTLLPKLISGELRVHDAERFLKERGL